MVATLPSEVIVVTISGATSDDKTGIMTTSGLQSTPWQMHHNQSYILFRLIIFILVISDNVQQ